MKERQINTQSGAVHYWTSDIFDKSRDTIVFLHGLTADHTLFDMQIPHFSHKYNIITWDAPAHGKSRPYIGFNYPGAAEILKMILEENNVASAVMAGQSMGGYIIQSLLLRYPRLVRAFIAIDTCPYGTGYYSKSDMWWLRQVEWMSRLYPLGLLKKSIAAQCAQTDYARENMAAALAPYGKNELCRLMGIGYAGFLDDNRDIKISCPTLILAGEHDRTGKVLSYCRAWSKKTGFPLKIIKNAAHNSNADNPREVNDAIDDFLGQL